MSISGGWFTPFLDEKKPFTKSSTLEGWRGKKSGFLDIQICQVSPRAAELSLLLGDTTS